MSYNAKNACGLRNQADEYDIDGINTGTTLKEKQKADETGCVKDYCD